MDIFVASYTASKAFQKWGPAWEDAFFHELGAVDGVTGIETPWLGRIHHADDDWMLAWLKGGGKNWKIQYTTAPATLKHGAADPRYGLASPDEASRQAAVSFFAEARQKIRALEDLLHRQPVAAVALFSAPKAVGSAEALRRSLDEITGWDWGDVRLWLEHCDRYKPGQSYQKGFLSLNDEIDAVRANGSPILANSLNWGRSAIEFRDGDRVVEHVRQAAAFRLDALTFSGANDRPVRSYDAWSDFHAPFGDGVAPEYREPTSVLTVNRVKAALAAAPSLKAVGLKIPGAWYGDDPKRRVEAIKAHLAIIRDAMAASMNST